MPNNRASKYLKKRYTDIMKVKGECNKFTIILGISTLLSQHLIEKVDKNNKNTV